jgi:hypothetical protein
MQWERDDFIHEMLQLPAQKQKRPIRENRPFVLSNPEFQRSNVTL